jgi:hypothetical protein
VLIRKDCFNKVTETTITFLVAVGVFEFIFHHFESNTCPFLKNPPLLYRELWVIGDALFAVIVTSRQVSDEIYRGGHPQAKIFLSSVMSNHISIARFLNVSFAIPYPC